MRRRHLHDQVNQASCLNLVTNAVVTWNTTYEQAVVEKLREECHDVPDDALVHLSPAMYGHINPYGKYAFDLEGADPTHLRPLRSSGPFAAAA